MNTKKILSLILVCGMLAGMVPAALAETPATEPNTSTVEGFHAFVDTKITAANDAQGTSDYMTLKRENATITVDFKEGKLGDTIDKITGTGLVDLISSVVAESDGCVLKKAAIDGVQADQNDPNKVPELGDLDVPANTDTNTLKTDIISACVGMLTSDPATLSDPMSIGTLVGHSLTVTVKLKSAASGQEELASTGPLTIDYTFQFVCSSNTTVAPGAPALAEDGNVAEVADKYTATFSLSANSPEHVLYRVYSTATGGSEVTGAFMVGSSTGTDLELCFEKAKVPAETTKYYIAAEKFGIPSTTRTEVTVVVMNYKDVTPSDGKNLSSIDATVTDGSAANSYSVAITGSDIVPGLEALSGISAVYNDFNPTTNSTWDRIPKSARNSDFTIVSLDLPAAPNATGIEIKQSSKALFDFYCAGKEAGATSDLDNRIVVDTGAASATKTKSYDADANGKIWMDFIMAKDDAVTFTVKHSDSLTVTYTVTAADLSFKAAESSGTTVDSTPTVNNNVATVTPDANAIGSAADAAAGTTDKVVTIDATASTGGGSVKKSEVTIPSAAIDAVDNKDVSLSIQTDVGGVTLPAEAVAAINASAGNDAVTVSLEKKDSATSGAEASFEFTITANSSPVTVNQPMTLSFHVGKNLTNPKIYYNPGSGQELVLLSGQRYDKDSGIVTAVTTHNSLYDIVDSGCAITFGTASNGGIGQKRDVTVALGSSYTSSGAYLTVQVTNSDNKNLFFTTKVTGASSTVPISYVSGGTVKAWLTAGEPNISTGGVIGTILDTAE